MPNDEGNGDDTMMRVGGRGERGGGGSEVREGEQGWGASQPRRQNRGGLGRLVLGHGDWNQGCRVGVGIGGGVLGLGFDWDLGVWSEWGVGGGVLRALGRL